MSLRDFFEGRYTSRKDLRMIRRHVYYRATILDDEGDLVIYGMKWPSFSYWLVPGTQQDD